MVLTRRSSVLVAFVVLLVDPASGMAGSPVPTASAIPADRDVLVENTDHEFRFEFSGSLMDQRDWPEITDPVKFVYEAILKTGQAEVFVTYWTLDGVDGDWWMDNVSAFLFEPENDVSVDVTRNGYDVIFVRMPIGPQAPASIDALVVAPGGAFRFTCMDCDALGGTASLLGAVDSLYAPGE